MKNTIAVIGATGNMGVAISKSLSKGNYNLLISANDKAKLEALMQDIRKINPVTQVSTFDYTDTGWEADVIILAIPYAAEKEVAESIRQVASNKVIISIANPLNETYSGLVTSPDTSAAEELQKLLPDSKVVKAFNTTFAADFSSPVIAGKQVDALIAGNNEEALQTASELVSTAGFNPIIAGDLPISRTLENMAFLLIQLTMKNDYNWLAGFKILHAKA